MATICDTTKIGSNILALNPPAIAYYCLSSGYFFADVFIGRSVLSTWYGSSKMVQVLMVAEKPSLAKSLGEILSHNKCNRRKSMCSACDVYEFKGQFPGPGGRGRGLDAHFKMTSVCGHVMSLDFLPKYNRWDSVDPVRVCN